MARFLFPEWTETLKKWVLLLVLGAPVYIIALVAYGVTPEAIRIGYQPEQPVPFDHSVHTGELGMDCRYCHDTVEDAAHAAVPPAETCMNCHEGILPESEDLLPVRESYATGDAVEWTRVHNLPGYVYFDHSAHVSRGVGCESCHGRVDQMEEVYQAEPLTMKWCLDCHRDPESERRPLDKITEMGYAYEDEPPAGVQGHIHPLTREERIEEDFNPAVNPLTDCSTCHR